MTRLRLRVDRKAFGAAPPVLDNIALTLGPREIVALLGPSGCGKTTLLRIAAGLDRDFAGSLTWEGEAPRLGAAFQEPLLLPWRSVRQNLLLALPDPGLTNGADSLLRALGVWAARDELPAKLSLGMARRVAIARALAVAPDFLVLDEPFASLDPEAARGAREVVLDAWRSRPMAVLMVTHEAEEAAAMADRVLVMGPGVIAEIVIPEQDRRGDGARAVAIIRRAQFSARLDQDRTSSMDPSEGRPST